MATSSYHFTAKRTASEVPWTPPYNYDCPGGHYLQADRPLDRCPVTTCESELVRVGKGSRKAVTA